jgi:hypothetical protein
MPRRSLRVALLACAFLLALLVADAKVTGKDKGKKMPARAVKSDVKYIKCQVCEEIAKVLTREASSVRKQKGSKLTEADVLEKVEKVCDPAAEEGEWLVKHDLVEKGTALQMKFMGAEAFGKCNSECKTMQRACEDIVSDRDTDIAEMLFTNENVSLKDFKSFLCLNEEEDALGCCLEKPPPLRKDRKKGPSFEATDKKEIEMQRMMKQMEAMGMGGMQMYGRDDMADMISDYDDDSSESGGFGGGGGDFSGGGDASDDAVLPSASVAEKAKVTAKNAWSSVKNFGKGLADKVKATVIGNPEDNIELR